MPPSGTPSLRDSLGKTQSQDPDDGGWFPASGLTSDMWMVVNIVVPFGGTINIRCSNILWIQKRDLNFDNHPCDGSGFWLWGLKHLGIRVQDVGCWVECFSFGV